MPAAGRARAAPVGRAPAPCCGEPDAASRPRKQSVGTKGHDYLVGGTGFDSVDGGQGTDTCSGEIVQACEL